MPRGVIVRAIEHPLEAERVLIESNRQREKTMSEVMREAEHIGRIEAAYAKERQVRQPADSVVANLPPQSKGKTRDKVAEQVGKKTGTFRNIQTVWDAANDEKTPEPIRAVAQQQMAALDTKDATPHSAARLMPPFAMLATGAVASGTAGAPILIPTPPRDGRATRPSRAPPHRDNMGDDV